MSCLSLCCANPQQTTATGPHLRHLEDMYQEGTFVPLEFILARLMIVGASFRMVADTARYMSHAACDCWQNRTITSKAIDSLSQATRHLALFIFNQLVGLLSPTLVTKVAERAGILPHRCWLDTVESVTTSFACITLAFGACFCAARAILMTDRYVRLLTSHRLWQLGAKYGETNVKAATIASGVLAGSVTGYKLGSYVYDWSAINGLWMCYKFVTFVCLPRNFSL